jgi:hypothetical protein
LRLRTIFEVREAFLHPRTTEFRLAWIKVHDTLAPVRLRIHIPNATRFFCLTALSVALILNPQALAADDPIDAQAATEIIQNLQGTLGDLSTILDLPPEQRVSWVVNEAPGRIKEKVLEEAKTQLVDAMDAYAVAAFRAKAFQDVAVPAFKHASATGGHLDWSLLESRMASEVDTRTRAYGMAVTGITIGWDSVEAFSNEGPRAGFLKLAGGVYEAVADAYIPGWGWFKLGMTAVEALGNHVINYATDTATEGMLDDMFDKSSNPQGFARMLQTIPLSDLYLMVDDRWELVAYGRVWKGQGTEAGDEAMKQRLKDTIYNIKLALARQEQLQRQKEQAVQARCQPLLDAAAQAEAAMKQLAAQTQSQAEPLLSQVRGFQKRMGALQEQAAEAQAAHYAQQAQSEPDAVLPYTPLNRTSVTALFESAYAMVSAEIGGAFDYETLSRELHEANLHRWEVVDGQQEPPDGPGKTEWLAHRSADRLALANEIAAIGYAADQRAATLAETLRNRVLGLRAQLKAARSTLDTELAAVVAEAQENLWFPNTLALYTWGDFTENWLFAYPFYNDWMGFWIHPAVNYAQMAGFLAGVESDRDELLAYNMRVARAYADYQAVVDAADRALREIFAAGTQDFQVTNRGSDELLYLWSMTNHYAGKMDLVLDELPLTAEVVHPELLTARFDPDRAISRIRARMSELQADYDLAQLQKGLAQVVVLLRDKLSPFWTHNAPDHGFSLLGRVNGILDYRKSVEETDLSDFVSRLTPIWEASQTRLALLGRHPTLVRPDDINDLTRFGQDLAVYETLLDGDRQTRAEAPDRAEQLMASLGQSLANVRPVLRGMNPEYYEETLASLQNTLKIAQNYLVRSTANDSPVYVLMENDLRAFMPAVLEGLAETLQAYQQVLPTYSMTMPKVTPGAPAVAGTVGQSLTLAFAVDTPGGTFSSQNLPAGLTLNPVSGAVQGVPGNPGTSTIAVAYTAPSGVTTVEMVTLTVLGPPPPTQNLAFAGGTPMLTMNGTPGLEYIIQAKKTAGPESRWVTLATRTQQAGAGVEWMDPEGSGTGQRFYRIVWVP